MFRRRHAKDDSVESTSGSVYSPRTQAAVTSDIVIPPPPEAQAEFALGNKLLSDSKPKKHQTTKHWKRAAALGHIDATHALGVAAIENGQQALAFEYLRKAADAGHTDSCYRVGRMYLYGQGIEKDPQAGVAYLMRAASKQCIRANRELGHYYANGSGDAKDNAKALVYYNAAIASGSQDVHYAVGKIYHEMHQHDLAVQQYQLAITQHDRRAMYRLGMCHATGCGVAPDPKRAAELLIAAGDQYFMPDNYAIAQRFENGDGVTQDRAAAVRFYQFAWEAAVEEGIDLEAIYTAEAALMRLHAPFDPKRGRISNCVYRCIHRLTCM
jgi:TPR repeat protein